MRIAGATTLVAALALAGCGKGESAGGATSGATTAKVQAALGYWDATDACKLVDKAKVAGATGSAVTSADLAGATPAADGRAALSTCTYKLANGAYVGVLTRLAAPDTKLSETLASAEGPEAKAMGMSFEHVDGVGKAALWNVKMNSLQVFFDDRRYSALNIMMAPKGTDTKAQLSALAKSMGA